MSEQDYTNVRVEMTLPKPWEEETTFNDVLYDWMGRAPWLAISAAAHILALFILSAFMDGANKKQQAPALQASVEATPEEIIEEPEEEEIEEIEEEIEPIEEPIIRDVEVSDHNEEDVDQPFESMVGDPDNNADSPFDSDNQNDVMGIGGGAAGKYGRGGGRRNLQAARGGKALDKALKDALEWLKDHQSSDGSWDCDGFQAECGKVGDGVCDGAGKPQHDVGVTALALLAFLGEGNTTNEGVYKEQVASGVAWLRGMQDPDSGLIGDKSNHEFLYDHSIATLALCEAYYSSKNPLLKKNCQKAVNYINRARNYNSAWRYQEPGNGENDTSVTGWMVFALKAAEDAKLTIDTDAYAGAKSWFDEVTDTTNGRVGYNEVGSFSSRITGVNDNYPPQKGEGMTAVALLSRVFMGEDPDSNSMLKKHGDLLLTKLPEWDPDGLGNDMYYWYYGTYAMYQMGGKYWSQWEATLKPELVDNQTQKGDEKGSWDTNGPWGHAGGRVYSTALMALCIEVYFRYPNVAGAR